MVTGASSGIGAATALGLLAGGWQVVAAARRLDRLEELAAAAPGLRVVQLDVTDEDSVAALALAVPDASLLVANAGAAFDLAPVGAADADSWARTYDLNVLGVVRCVRSLLPSLRHVIITGSTAGRWVYEQGGSYVASKHALAAVRDILRLELAEAGVRVSEVAPGLVATEEFSLVRFRGDAVRAAAVYEGVEALTAEDVAAAICWVAAQPPHVNIDLLQLTPQQQAGASKLLRRP